MSMVTTKMMSMLPSTVMRYIVRNSPNKRGWISGSSVSFIGQNFEVHVIFCAFLLLRHLLRRKMHWKLKQKSRHLDSCIFWTQVGKSHIFLLEVHIISAIFLNARNQTFNLIQVFLLFTPFLPMHFMVYIFGALEIEPRDSWRLYTHSTNWATHLRYTSSLRYSNEHVIKPRRLRITWLRAE
jgi:hypothetical protein